MTIDLVSHIKQLSLAAGLSAYEVSVRDVVSAAWQPLADEVTVDKFGSLWATKKGSGRAPRFRAMLAAHMDAIGLMVTKIDGAFLRITEVGGIDVRVLPGQQVLVHASHAPEPLPAIVGSRPPHVLKPADRDKVLSLGDLVVDPGLPAAEVARLVQIGDLITFDQPPFEMQDDLLVGKSFDNRVSVAAVTVCLEALRERKHEWDVVAVATTQEEHNLGGARTAAYDLQPDIAIVLDVTWAAAPGVPEHRAFALGEGPTIGLGPNVNPKLHEALVKAAKDAEIPHHVEIIPRHSGTDAFAIQVSRNGVNCGLVGIPLRNMHTPVEIISVRDVSRTGRLLAEFVSGLDSQFLDTLKWD
jgi:endoglucanase